MPGKTDKRKKAEQDSGDEIQPGRPKKFRRTGSRTVSFATTIQAISFDEDEQPNSILETQPTSFPTALGSPERAQSPSPSPSKQPEEQPFTADQANELSKIATAALQTLEKKQLQHDLALARRDLELSKNDNENLRWRMEMYMKASELADRALEDATKRLNDAEKELKVTLRSNERLEDMLRSANETVEEVQCEIAVVREEKAEMEKFTRGEREGGYGDGGTVGRG